MTNWYKAQAMEMPEEYDKTSSPTTVYQRKDIRKIELPAMEGQEKVEGFEYMERQMTQEEYAQIQAELESPATKMIMQQLSALELQTTMLAEMMEV